MDPGTFYMLQQMSHDELRLWLSFTTMQKGTDLRQLYDDVGKVCGKTMPQIEQLMGQMIQSGWFYQDPRTGNIQHGPKLRELAQQAQQAQQVQYAPQPQWPPQQTGGTYQPQAPAQYYPHAPSPSYPPPVATQPMQGLQPPSANPTFGQWGAPPSTPQS